eukprot:7756247-Heterocapsa_arctica.AAC.1
MRGCFAPSSRPAASSLRAMRLGTRAFWCRSLETARPTFGFSAQPRGAALHFTIGELFQIFGRLGREHSLRWRLVSLGNHIPGVFNDVADYMGAANREPPELNETNTGRRRKNKNKRMGGKCRAPYP